MKTHSTEKPHMCDKVRGGAWGGLAASGAGQEAGAALLSSTAVREVL